MITFRVFRFVLFTNEIKFKKASTGPDFLATYSGILGMDLLVFGKKYLPYKASVWVSPPQGGAVSLPGSSLMSPLRGSQALIAKGTKDEVKQAQRAISYKLRPVGSPRLVY